MIKYEHLVGLPWQHGVNDCFQLLRRFYADNYDVQIRRYAYPEAWWTVAPQEDFFTRLARREGFLPVLSESTTEMRPGFGLAISAGVPFASHCGVWIGNGHFLHQPHGELSRLERWAGRWAARTISIWKHPTVPTNPVGARIDLIDLLPAAKRERYREILAQRAL